MAFYGVYNFLHTFCFKSVYVSQSLVHSYHSPGCNSVGLGTCIVLHHGGLMVENYAHWMSGP